MRSPVVIISVSAVLMGSGVPLLQSSVAAQTTPSTPATSSGQNQGGRTVVSPLQQATGQLKTDSAKTKEDVKALDVMKATQDVSDVKKDVQGIENSAKDLLSNPFGK